MAGREKKPALNKKQIPSPVPQKEGAGAPENASPDATEMPNIITATRRKPIAKRTIKRKLRVGFKPAKKKPALKITKAIFSVAQASLSAKKATLIKNGLSAPKRIRKPKGQTVPAPKEEVKTEPNDEPPVLEPMEPLPSENGVPLERKESKKRYTKKTASVPPDIQNEVKPTLDPAEGAIETPTNSTDQTNTNEATKKIVKKGKPAKKGKEVTETLDDVMNDLAERINMDTDVLKMKKIITRKLKMDSPKRKTFKKDGLISLNKDLTSDSSAIDTNVIDMLDLNVSKRPKKPLTKKRRHSIEKFPATAPAESLENSAFTLFPSTPRSVSPRSKRGSKIRQSVDTSMSTRRSSPYTTRSDSPARILRNGKQRKLKDFLLEGIETVYQKRRRLCSDLSGSELSISRNSGFESDTSSYSDLAPPLDNSGDVSDNQRDGESTAAKSVEVKKDILDSSGKLANYQIPDEVKNLDIKSISTKFTAILKRSLSTEAAAERQLELQAAVAAAANGASEPTEELPPNIPDNNITDTNSNLCNDVKPDITNLTPNIPIKTESAEDFSDSQNVNIKLCPESKVPEKNFILDIMKQTFNEQEKEDQEKEKRPTRSSARIKKTRDKSEENAANKIGEEKAASKSEEKVVVKAEGKPDMTMSVSKFYGAPTENSDKDSSETPPTVVAEVAEVAEPAEKIVETEEVEPTPECNETQAPAPIEEKEEEIAKKNDEIDVDTLIEIEEVESKSELQSEMLMKALVAETAEYVEKTLLGKGLDSNLETDIEVDDFLPSTNGGEKMNVDSSNTENITDDVQLSSAIIEETPENLAKKENILQALGLQSLKAAAEAKLREKVVPKQDNYTGTLKTVIKINRGMEKQKRRRNSLKMTIHKKGKNKDGTGELGRSEDDSNYRISKEAGTAPWRHQGTHSSDTAGAHRKTHYSNRSNLGNYGFGLILQPFTLLCNKLPLRKAIKQLMCK